MIEQLLLLSGKMNLLIRSYKYARDVNRLFLMLFKFKLRNMRIINYTDDRTRQFVAILNLPWLIRSSDLLARSICDGPTEMVSSSLFHFRFE